MLGFRADGIQFSFQFGNLQKLTKLTFDLL